jgi:hypothetical protein
MVEQMKAISEGSRENVKAPSRCLRVKNQSVREKSNVLNQLTNHQKRAGSAVSLPSTSCLQLQWMPECIVLAATALCLAVGRPEETSFFAVRELTGCPVETGTNSTAVTFNT